jgi:hypothetical protein
MAPGLQQINSLENIMTSRTMLAMKFNGVAEEFDNPEEVARECILVIQIEGGVLQHDS